MRVALCLALLAATALAFDSVIFSPQQKITKDTPSVEELVKGATVDHPAIIFTTSDFFLGHFSRAAAAPDASALIASARAAPSTVSRHVDDIVIGSDAVHVEAGAPLVKGAKVYVIHGASFAAIDEASATVLSTSSPSVVIITNAAAVTEHVRAKRVAMSDAAALGAAKPGPLVAPDVLNKETPQTCLFYLEGINVNLYSLADKKEIAYVPIRASGTKDAATGAVSAECEPVTEGGKTSYSQKFTVSMVPESNSGVSGPVNVVLTFTTNPLGDWSLTSLELTDSVKVGTYTAAAGKAADVSRFGANSVFGWGWNCWDTDAVFFKTNDEKVVMGLGFHGIQVHTYGMDGGETGKGMTYFRTNTESCTGTFSIGSWMGLFSILVMVSVLIFGYLMLNSVQSQGRFDDPKAKQIQINVRE